MTVDEKAISDFVSNKKIDFDKMSERINIMSNLDRDGDRKIEYEYNQKTFVYKPEESILKDQVICNF